ncbi:uncharacterized protein LOC108911264 [Anoplophora glabripennis]|uniref:uncharacterized protein LOC108911264 n=1 Tax=Anoplophora glabripennis TaxID=217634 RepID=UPI000873B682|nr:uncharacterized protein LOC108911264 [Anoplophora glabripennis]
MSAKISISIAVLVFLNAATSALICYDCDAGRECEDPELFNVRSVNCEKQYPNELQSNIVCLALDITLTGTRGFNMYKSGIYRGCRVIPKEEEAIFCDNLKTSHADRMQINSCEYCNSTRCIP